MSTVVIQNQMHVQGIGHGLIDRIEKLPKFIAAMTPMNLTDNASCFHFQGGKQRGRSMPFVVVTPAFGLIGPHGKHQLRSVQCLDLRLLIDAQHQRRDPADSDTTRQCRELSP